MTTKLGRSTLLPSAQMNDVQQAGTNNREWDEVAETRTQLVRYLVVGLSTVAFDLIVYLLLSQYAGIAPSIAKGISYIAGVVCVGFVLNKLWTFRSAEKSVAEPITYLTIYIITLFVNIGCNQLALSILGAEQKLVAFLFATGVTTVLNFLGMRFIAFRKGIQNRKEAEIQQHV